MTAAARARALAKAAAQAQADRIAAYEKALPLVIEWGEKGMPPCAAIGCHIGILVGLVGKGFAEELPRDRIGDLRFRATPKALAPDAHTRLRESFR